MAKKKKKEVLASCYVCEIYEKCRHERSQYDEWKGVPCHSFSLWGSLKKQGVSKQKMEG